MRQLEHRIGFDRGPATTAPRDNGLRDVLGVPTDAVDHCGRHGVEKVQAYEVESRFIGDNSAPVDRLSVVPENREVDPGEAGVVSGTPDHIRYVEDASVPQQGKPVANTNSPGDPADPRRRQVLRL